METQEKKNYKCQICEKSFTTAQHKDRHMKTHNGDKPYSYVKYVVNLSQGLMIDINI